MHVVGMQIDFYFQKKNYIDILTNPTEQCKKEALLV